MINILISVNEAYLPKAETMLCSMREHTDEDITVYLLNHRLPPRLTDAFSAFLAQKCRAELRLVDVSHTPLDDFPTVLDCFSIEMYYRILAQFLLPASLERILWLDADIILLGDLAPFYHSDFAPRCLCRACRDVTADTPQMRAHKATLGLEAEHTYFNSGVLLLNLAALRRETQLDDILSRSLALRDRLLYPDQDILNTLYTGRVDYADASVYNRQLTDCWDFPPEEAARTVVLHYSGQKKPWKYKNLHPTARYYWRVRCRAQGAWAETALVYTLHAFYRIYCCFYGHVVRPLRGY